MKNEIARKITSLTIMTIMVAGGLTFAIPGVVPAYAATENLFVSAESSLSDDNFAGPMVIEVLVNDPALKEIDSAQSEPDVTVNGKDLRMVQATDGNWYAYFADRDMARAADAVSETARTSLDFGTLCSQATLGILGGTNAAFSETEGVFIAAEATVTDEICGIAGLNNPAIHQNVVREAKTPTTLPSNIGQVELTEGAFPFIQLYSFKVDGQVEVKYNKGGGTQTITLKYTDSDIDDFASLDKDRDDYPQDAAVHLTINNVVMNIDPTDEDSWTFGTNPNHINGTTAHYQVFDENGAFATNVTAIDTRTAPNVAVSELNFGDSVTLSIDPNTQGSEIIELRDNDDQILYIGDQTEEASAPVPYSLAALDRILQAGTGPVTFVETEANTGIFTNTDEADISNIKITDVAERTRTATIDYNDAAVSVTATHYGGEITIDSDAVGGTWNSGEPVPVELSDGDLNKNSKVSEDIDASDAEYEIIPSVRINEPITLATNDGISVTIEGETILNEDLPDNNDFTVDSFSDRMILDVETTIPQHVDSTLNVTFVDMTDEATITEFLEDDTNGAKYEFLNYDVRSLGSGGTVQFSLDDEISSVSGIRAAILLGEPQSEYQGLIDITDVDVSTLTGAVSLHANFTGRDGPDDNDSADGELPVGKYPVMIDFFSFGQTNDGEAPSHRVNNAIYRLLLEESGDNTGVFSGSMEFLMLNQLNINQTSTYTERIDSFSDEIVIIVHNDLTDEDSVRINYLDVDGDGVATQTSSQIAAPTHSGVVSFDSNNYKIADTVTVTLVDPDLNTDVETKEVYTVVDTMGDVARDAVGEPEYGLDSTGDQFGRLLDITFDDERWTDAYVGSEICDPFGGDQGLADTGFTLAETTADSGEFVGTFQIPPEYCSTNERDVITTTGKDLEVNYVDFRDISGEKIEVGDSAGIRANTGSVSLDRSVYPVPFGVPGDFATISGDTPNGRSIFPVHAQAITGDIEAPDSEDYEGSPEFVPNGDLMIHVRVNDPDFDISASGEDTIAQNVTTVEINDVDYHFGPVEVSVTRGSDKVILATAGADEARGSTITVGDVLTVNQRELGPIEEVSPDSGIFELDLTIRYTDGPASNECPETLTYESFSTVDVGTADLNDEDYCILQGDILTVEYTDPTDASGSVNTVTDSATFDLRNGVLQSDKSVYIIGSDMILTLIEPDFDLDNDERESYDLDLIEWDSDAADISMGDLSSDPDRGSLSFDPEPTVFRETGDSTGIFQVVIEIPNELGGERLDRGEEIELEYTDWGPSGADFVGDEDEDVNLTIFTSNFGATIELDQKVYTWTDKVYITIVAPDHNNDADLIDRIGEDGDPIRVATSEGDLEDYRLTETGVDTGVFTGEVILTGFEYDADGDGDFDAIGNPPDYDSRERGPTDGLLEAEEDDGISVSFEFSEDETVVSSSLIRWNIGEVQWLEASYPATGSGTVRVIDPDMNWNPEAVDNFEIDVKSNSDTGGIQLTVTETNKATGIFEGTVSFDPTDQSEGHRLRVAEGDTVTADYEDNTLPPPSNTNDQLDVKGTTFIGTIVPPLERAPVTNARIVDSQGSELSSVSVDQQIQIAADLTSGQDRDQDYAYLIQVQDSNGVTVKLDWIDSTLAPGQSTSPKASWTPDMTGQFTATVFVWESVTNPTALSPPATVQINVQ